MTKVCSEDHISIWADLRLLAFLCVNTIACCIQLLGADWNGRLLKMPINNDSHSHEKLSGSYTQGDPGYYLNADWNDPVWTVGIGLFN